MIFDTIRNYKKWPKQLFTYLLFLVFLIGLKLEFERFWTQVLAKAEEFGIEEPKLPRKKLKPSFTTS